MSERQQSPDSVKPHVVLTDRDRRLLHYVARFRLVSRDQAMVLGPFNSLTRANTRLASLVHARLLTRKRLPILPGEGSAQALYYLGLAGVTAIDGGSLEAHKRQIRQITRWDLRQVRHVLAANQVLVDLMTALRHSAETELMAFRTEPDLRELFVRRELVPDGWIAWRQGGRRFNAFIEVDLHHEGLVAWRKKIVAYQAYLASGLHQELLGFKACRVMVLVKSRTRLNHLRTLAQVAGRLCLFGELGNLTVKNMLEAAWLPASGHQVVALKDA